MKVVLLHDWLTGFRGGERVLEALCEMFPDAPLYTLIHKKGSVPKCIENRKVVTSFLDKVPGIYKHYRKFLPFFPLAVEMMKIEEDADLVISSSHCVIKGLKKPTGSKHLCYIHSPMRYLYDQYDSYFGPDAPLIQRLGMKLCRGYLTSWDMRSNENVDQFIANSDFVRQRIQKYYKREALVVHPFVDLDDFQKEPAVKEDFYLMVTAFAPNKRVDLAVKAFNELGLKLKIIGSGQQEEYLKSLACDNVEFLGNLSRQEVVDYFYRAKAFIFPGVEDFGITPLESLASGTPVIAFQKGGVLETLNDEVAVFFQEASLDSLKDAILRYEEKTFSKEALVKRSLDFSKESFKKNIEQYVKEVSLKK